MIRRTLAALAAAAALAGCPLPQPLPDYPAGTTITPPRILIDAISMNGTPSNAQPVVLVPADCPREPTYQLSAQVFDTNNLETIDARWFVNYNAQWNYAPALSNAVAPDLDPLVLTRTVPPPNPDTGDPRPFEYRAYTHRPPVGTPPPAENDPPFKEAGLVRVVELVVSNGFDPDAIGPPAALANRTPRPGFETQVYRWVFVTVPAPPGCTLGDPGCCPAP